jgi:H+/Cl- antiporter ClcA
VNAARVVVAGGITAALCGVFAAAFLLSLDIVTTTRSTFPLLIWCLPVIGLLLGAAIDRFGTAAAPGMSLVIDGLVDGTALPPRLAPQVVVGTLLTHLGGGSAGREGTAVQMGAGTAELVARRFHVVDATARRVVITAGVAAGFGAVFGTPWAGALFAIEVPVVRRLQLKLAPIAVMAALLGDVVARACGATHTSLPQPPLLTLSVDVFARWCAVAVVVAAVTIAFVVALRELKRLGERHIPARGVRLALGGVVVVVLWRAWGDDTVLGLGVPSIVASLDGSPVSPMYWLAKFATTVVTVGSGFVGGEVTPLFGIGASLGQALSSLVGLPSTLTAAVCMCALLAAATRTPLAVVVMALELFGATVWPHVLVVVVVAAVLAARFGIYGAQRSPTTDAMQQR